MSYSYQEPYPLQGDNTEYKKLSSDHVSTSEFEGKTVLKIEREALKLLAK